MVLVRIQHPNLPVSLAFAIKLNQLLVFGRVHGARPHGLGAVDIGSIPDPFFMQAVSRSVADQYQLPAGRMLQLPGDRVAGGGEGAERAFHRAA